MQFLSLGLRSISGDIVIVLFVVFVFSEVSWPMKPFQLGLASMFQLHEIFLIYVITSPH